MFQYVRLMNNISIIQKLRDYLSIFHSLNPGVAFLYPLKTSENLKFSDVFRGHRKLTPGCNGLKPARIFVPQMWE